MLSFHITPQSRLTHHHYKITATTSSVTHTHSFNRASFLVGYDCLLITSLLWGHVCVTPIKDDGSHCGWNNISTYLHLSQKQIKTDMWAVCHTDTRAFPRNPAKSSEWRWVITFCFSLTAVPHSLQAFITIAYVQCEISIISHGAVILFICFWHSVFAFTDSFFTCHHVLCRCQDLALWGVFIWWDSPLLLLWQWPLTEYFWPHWPLAFEYWHLEAGKCEAHAQFSYKQGIKNRTLFSPCKEKEMLDPIFRQQLNGFQWNFVHTLSKITR